MNATTFSKYQIDGTWFVGVFGNVEVGNGRTTFGYIKEIRCADESCANAIIAHAKATSKI